MPARMSLAAAAVAVLLTIAPAAAAGGADDAARQLAAAIEQRADKTSFADLERFGEQAAQTPGRESLRRLEHVSTIMLNQSEFDRFEHWNGLLAARARTLGDRRYQVMAEINELMARYSGGDTSVRPQLEHIADAEPDVVARAHATSYVAQLRVEDGEVGAALKQLFATKDLIPSDDVDASTAESEVWETIGIALMQLDDLEGAARAFDKADFELANRAYPRPDFDDVYNMAHLAVQLGDASLARDLAATHHRLALRSDLPHLDAWDKNLCGMVADSFGPPREVMACLNGLDQKLTGAEFLAPQLLTVRALAAARMGDVKDARADLERLRAAQASHQYADAAFERMPRVAAELLAAEGQYRPAFAMMSDYSRLHSQTDARRFTARRAPAHRPAGAAAGSGAPAGRSRAQRGADPALDRAPGRALPRRRRRRRGLAAPGRAPPAPGPGERSRPAARRPNSSPI